MGMWTGDSRGMGNFPLTFLDKDFGPEGAKGHFDLVVSQGLVALLSSVLVHSHLVLEAIQQGLHTATLSPWTPLYLGTNKSGSIRGAASFLEWICTIQWTP